MSFVTVGCRKYQEFCTAAYVLRDQFAEKYGRQAMFLTGAGLLGIGLADFSQAQPLVLNDERIRCAAHQLLALTEGNMGALLMVVAGLATIISAAFGAFRAATSLLVVACSAFILRSLVHIFFNLGSVPPGCAVNSVP